MAVLCMAGSCISVSICVLLYMRGKSLNVPCGFLPFSASSGHGYMVENKFFVFFCFFLCSDGPAAWGEGLQTLQPAHHAGLSPAGQFGGSPMKCSMKTC